jgi:hypothetical protein
MVERARAALRAPLEHAGCSVGAALPPGQSPDRTPCRQRGQEGLGPCVPGGVALEKQPARRSCHSQDKGRWAARGWVQQAGRPWWLDCGCAGG